MGESNIFGQETTHERSSSYDPTIQRYQNTKYFVKKKILICTLAQLICDLTNAILNLNYLKVIFMG